MEIKLGKKSAYATLLTPKGELTGFNAIFEPSTKFNKEGTYSADIILSKEDGEKVLAAVKSVQKEQFKNFKKQGDKLAEIACIKPIATVDEETGEETLDSEGRYILKAKNSAKIENDTVGFSVAVFDAKVHPVSKIRIGAGSTVKLKLDLVGYCVAGKVGVSVKLKAVQIINFVPYVPTAINAAEGFEEEEGYEFSEEDAVPEKEAETKAEEEEDEEDDF